MRENELRVNVENTRWDIWHFHLHEETRPRSFLLTILFLAAIAPLPRLINPNTRNLHDYLTAIPEFFPITFGVLFVVQIIAILVPVLFFRSVYDVSPREFSIEEPGIRITGDKAGSLIKWRGIRRLVQTNKILAIESGWSVRHIIPAHSFKSQSEFERFRDQLNTRRWTQNDRGKQFGVENYFTRLDYFLINLILIRRNGFDWRSFLFFLALTAPVMWVLDWPTTISSTVTTLLYAGLMAAGLTIVTPLAIALLIMLFGGERAGFGYQQYTIEAGGLREDTLFKEELMRWSTTGRIIRTQRYLIIERPPLAIHVITARSFRNADAFQAFADALENAKTKSEHDG